MTCLQCSLSSAATTDAAASSTCPTIPTGTLCSHSQGGCRAHAFRFAWAESGHFHPCPMTHPRHLLALSISGNTHRSQLKTKGQRPVDFLLIVTTLAPFFLSRLAFASLYLLLGCIRPLPLLAGRVRNNNKYLTCCMPPSRWRSAADLARGVRRR